MGRNRHESQQDETTHELEGRRNRDSLPKQEIHRKGRHRRLSGIDCNEQKQRHYARIYEIRKEQDDGNL